MPFARFMELALYDSHVGYYRRNQARVGRRMTTDFFTATSSGPVFGELIVAACVKLLGSETARASTFVEIGAEPESGGVLNGVAHPFQAARILRLDDALSLSGHCIVFSNELFDAQPFRRFVFRAGAWRELGVRLGASGALHEVEIAASDTPSLPSQVAEGTHFDAPLAAAALAERIARESWRGLFLACDYGKSFRELAEACPAGTARAYYRHEQSNELLARPGEQDLTCHICWDWLSDALAQHGFTQPTVESQEAFFVNHSGDFIAKVLVDEAARFSPRKLSLMQLLHPANMGQKFQVLHALRP